MSKVLQSIRLRLPHRCRPPVLAAASVHLRFYKVAHLPLTKENQIVEPLEDGSPQAHLIKPRCSNQPDYPRIESSKSVSCQNFANKYRYLEKGDRDVKNLTIRGMLEELASGIAFGLCF